MHVRIEEQSPVSRRVVVTVPAQRVAREFSGAYNRLGQRVSLPGFRRGKVPLDYLRTRYGAQVSVEVAQSLLDEGWQSAVREHDLSPVNPPRIDGDLERVRPDAEFTFSFVVEVAPEVELANYYGLSVEKTDWQVTDAHVDHELTHVAEGAATWEPVGDRDIAADGDMAVVDFIGRVAGVPFDGGTAEDFEVVLGEGRLIPGFETQIVGHKVGEQFDITVTFPVPYGNKALEGKEAVFTATLKDLKAKIVPAIDDELAGTLGVENLEKLREEVKRRMVAQWDANAKQEAFVRLREQLATSYAFEVPPSLLEAERKARREDLERELDEGAEDRATRLEAAESESAKNAESSLRLMFVLDAIAEKESLEIEETELNRQIEVMVRGAGAYGARMRQAYRESGPRAQLRRRLRHDKVLDFLLSKANVALVPKEVPAHDHG
jgi:trigger factor